MAAELFIFPLNTAAKRVKGRPRATKDLDVWVEATAANAPRVMTALREFGAPLGLPSVRQLDAPVSVRRGLD